MALAGDKIVFYSYIVVLFLIRIVFNKLVNVLTIGIKYNTTLRYNSNYS